MSQKQNMKILFLIVSLIGLSNASIMSAENKNQHKQDSESIKVIGDIKRPPSTMVILVTLLQKDLPQKRGEFWWEATYQDGHKEVFSKPPTGAYGIKYLRFCINDFEKAVTSLGNAGSLIKLSPLDIHTYHYPAFWTGQEWVLEDQLRKRGPKVYEQLHAKVTLQHRAVIRVTQWRLNEKSILQNQAELGNLMAELKYGNPDSKRKDYLNQQIIHKQKIIKHTQSILNHDGSKKVFPTTLVRGLRFDEEMKHTQRDIQDIEKRIVYLQSEISNKTSLEKIKYQLELKQHQGEIQIYKESLRRFEQLKAEFIRKGWIFDVGQAIDWGN